MIINDVNDGNNEPVSQDSKDVKNSLIFNMETLSRIILFFEGYSSEILQLSNIYFILEEFLPQIKNQFMDIISKKKLRQKKQQGIMNIEEK